ncbi:MAG: hypothetical protein EXS47_00475 [Candidatus Zambryskibacteria bacterium]|nr:hypothetical protein [Candidatus Zambryskibacteria bacterium]
MTMTQSFNLRQTVLREMLECKLAQAEAQKPSLPELDHPQSYWGHMKHGLLFYLQLAQQRLARGEYGYCYDCNEEIEEDRLDEYFMYIRCKGCQKLHKSQGISPN